MALNTGINSLDAGAPELRLEGKQQAGGPYNTGSDVKNALNVWNNMGPQDRAEFNGFLDFFRTGAWRDQIQGMRQMQQQRSTAAQGGRMGYATGYAVAAPGQGGTGDINAAFPIGLEAIALSSLGINFETPFFILLRIPYCPTPGSTIPPGLPI